jgi:hypothetical protein
MLKAMLSIVFVYADRTCYHTVLRNRFDEQVEFQGMPLEKDKYLEPLMILYFSC